MSLYLSIAIQYHPPPLLQMHTELFSISKNYIYKQFEIDMFLFLVKANPDVLWRNTLSVLVRAFDS